MSNEIPDLNPLEKIEEVSYTADQSLEFDTRLKEKSYVRAPQDKLSPITTNEMLLSEWQVPCHCILLKSSSGDYQLLHVQPNKFSSSLLTYEQEQALKNFANKDSEAIVAKGVRSWFGPGDAKDIEDQNIKLTKVIPVETSNWWRFLFDPETNEIWIDVKDKQTLTKYKGF